MPRENKTRLAILGLLSWQPMSGYDIKKLVEMGLSHFWSESYGQLFPTLKRLVAEGLAVRKPDSGRGKRRRDLYSITRKGRRQFEKWLEEPSDEPRARNEFLLKFFLSSRMAPDQCIQLLGNYRAQQRERLRDYVESEQILTRAVRDDTLPHSVEEILSAVPAEAGRSKQSLIFLLTLRHGILAVQSRLTWCEEALKALRSSGPRSGVKAR